MLRILLGLLLASTQQLLLADQEARPRRDTPLYTSPASQAGNNISLSADSAVTVIKHKGAWVHIKTHNGADGWLPMTAIRLVNKQPAAKQRTASDENDDEVVSTDAVRGIRADTLQDAQPDLDAVKALEQLDVGLENAVSFAGELGLKSQEVEYLALTVAPEKQTDNDNSNLLDEE
ncbi:MAG: hypothetical protein BMS9Abin36_1982 [Gammaproteobacteria bacterium]|nr:MAG: hypothetical protein BMS9Abin36_1982 [Gammaproteobacteria bacterium]